MKVGFELLGWVHPDYTDEVRQLGVSPGMWALAAELGTFGALDLLRITRAPVLELSVTAEPARSGTTVTVGGPRQESIPRSSRNGSATPASS